LPGLRCASAPGFDVVVKHETRTPNGAEVRGGLACCGSRKRDGRARDNLQAAGKRLM